MKVYKQSQNIDNVYAVCVNLVSILKLNVTEESIRGITNHSQYPSMSSIIDLLNDWNVSAFGVRIDSSMLTDIPYPAIAHFDKHGGHFVVLTKFEDGQLSYIDPEIGTVTEMLKDFDKRWSGVVLLMETNDQSGEEEYKQKRREKIVDQGGRGFSMVLSICLLVLPTFRMNTSAIGIYLLNILGTFLTVLLLQKQFNFAGSLVESFCKLGSRSDCDSVINSPASKLFGVIHLSEVGLSYFVGSVLSIALAALFSVSAEPYLFVFTLVATVFSFFAIYYQAVVIKKWCLLCLTVVFVIWLQAILFFISPPVLVLDLNSSSVLFIGFSFPLIFWLSVRNRFIDSFKVANLQRNLNRFLKNDRVFLKLLEDQPCVDFGQFSHELQSGSINAPIQLVVVSNPQCGRCAYTHSVLESLKDALDEKLNIVYRFAVKTNDKSTVSYQMLESLFSIRQQESNERALAALSGWYQANGRLEVWKNQFSQQHQPKNNRISEILLEHEQWCTRVVIQKTPSIIINGKMLPEEFSVTDLKFQLRKLAERITEPESVR